MKTILNLIFVKHEHLAYGRWTHTLLVAAQPNQLEEITEYAKSRGYQPLDDKPMEEKCLEHTYNEIGQRDYKELFR